MHDNHFTPNLYEYITFHTRCCSTQNSMKYKCIQPPFFVKKMITTWMASWKKLFKAEQVTFIWLRLTATLILAMSNISLYSDWIKLMLDCIHVINIVRQYLIVEVVFHPPCSTATRSWRIEIFMSSPFYEYYLQHQRHRLKYCYVPCQVIPGEQVHEHRQPSSGYPMVDLKLPYEQRLWLI